MKKILAIFLALSMLLAMLTVPTFAAGEGATPVTYQSVAIPDSASLEKETRNGQEYDVYIYKGTEYLVIRTVAQFLAIDDKEGTANFILANDIDFAGVKLTAKGSWSNGEVAVFNGVAEGDGKYRLGTFHLEGNGYAMNNVTPPNTTAAGLFAVPVGDNHVVSNLTLNVPSVTFSNNSAGVLYGGQNTDTSGDTTLAINNVTINVGTFNVSGTGNFGIFVSKPRVPTTISNCNLNVTDFKITGIATGGVGGFVGVADSAVAITLTNCKATGNYTGNASGNSTSISPFVGLLQSNNVTLTFNNCTLDVNATLGTKSGGFVGFSKTGNITFNNCLAKGTYNMYFGQTGVYVGQLETTGTLSFDKCHADVEILSKGDTNGVYLGMSYGNNTINLTDCTSSGTFIDYANHTSRSWANAFIAVVGGGKTITVNFEGCETDMVLMGYGKIGAYIASTKTSSPNVTVNIVNCENNATILSGNVASAWFAENINGTVVLDGCTDNSTIIAASNVSFDGANTANSTVSLYDAANGELAYKLAEAQAAKGIDAKYFFGQTIGTDAQPKIGATTVYEIDTKMAETFYSNTIKGVYTVDKGDGNATAYSQVAKNGDKYNSRVIISVATAELEKVAAMEITLTYNLIDGSTKTFTVNKDQVSAYYSVYADDMVAEAADGYLLLAIVVKNIPNDVWSGNEADVVVGMTATDAEGAPIAAYTIGA